MSDIDADNEQEQQMLDAIDKWLERDVRPHVLRLEHADEYPIEMVEQMKELGLFGALALTPLLWRQQTIRSNSCFALHRSV